MKKRYIILTLLTSIIMSGCGGMYGNRGIENDISAPLSNSKSISYYSNSATEDSFDTFGDYSNTNISGDQADYSYSFNAGGKTNKSKQEMLDDYESIQKIVDDNNGYIENVYNNYDVYDQFSHYSNNNISYKAQGYLSFTIEIDNTNIPMIINELEKICANNKFTVTNYSQHIQNYKAWNTGNETDDYEEIITKEELNERLKYADINVRIDYYIQRPAITRFFLSVKKIWNDFWYDLGDIIKTFLILAAGLIIPFIQSIIFYKAYKKMIYKHRIKHPEYYAAKDINISNIDQIYQNTYENEEENYEEQ